MFQGDNRLTGRKPYNTVPDDRRCFFQRFPNSRPGPHTVKARHNSSTNSRSARINHLLLPTLLQKADDLPDGIRQCLPTLEANGAELGDYRAATPE